MESRDRGKYGLNGTMPALVKSSVRSPWGTTGGTPNLLVAAGYEEVYKRLAKFIAGHTMPRVGSVAGAPIITPAGSPRPLTICQKSRTAPAEAETKLGAPALPASSGEPAERVFPGGMLHDCCLQKLCGTPAPTPRSI